MKRNLGFFLPMLVLIAIASACTGGEASSGSTAEAIGDAERGRQVIAQYGCNVCHISPGVSGPQGRLGPSFEKIHRRKTISNGKIPNTPENLIRFIQNPASMNPQTAMPPMNVSPVDAQDITAYLLSLK